MANLQKAVVTQTSQRTVVEASVKTSKIVISMSNDVILNADVTKYHIYSILKHYLITCSLAYEKKANNQITVDRIETTIKEECPDPRHKDKTNKACPITMVEIRCPAYECDSNKNEVAMLNGNIGEKCIKLTKHTVPASTSIRTRIYTIQNVNKILKYT